VCHSSERPYGSYNWLMLTHSKPEPGIVWTWQNVALYFGRPVATVKRWHRFRPLPLSRIGRHVCVPKTAIDLWVLEAPKAAAHTRQPGRPTSLCLKPSSVLGEASQSARAGRSKNSTSHGAVPS